MVNYLRTFQASFELFTIYHEQYTIKKSWLVKLVWEFTRLIVVISLVIHFDLEVTPKY
ncbi:hypothetical protein BD847_2692 [Flavobacterium cutihirudinis]|uniref:Uncharacterized protein n=1 Tax=Flavobacterium cutihirudinis TaxID=1265740 RepID=A0A3D9FUL1_9FLAO|nr:hypothetical protein BD847_2692 [Flavobacterium cutihirudinis]